MRTILTTSFVLAALAGTAAADLLDKDVSTLKLRAQVHVRGEAVTLADVLVFTHADPRLLEELGEKPAVANLVAPTETEISHDQIVSRLEELGVNLARVLVDGAYTCWVTLEPLTTDVTAGAGQDHEPLIHVRRATGSGATLSEVLRSQVESELDATGGSVEIEFERAGQEFLELTTPPFDFAIRGNSGQRLGLRDFRVTIRRDGRVQRVARIGANVKLVKRVLVAAKPLNTGTYVRQDSLEYATRVFSSGDDLGIAHAERVIGQQVKAFVPAGQMLRDDDLKSVDLVKRSQPVTVMGGDNVSLRINGDALDSGSYGETIRVRIGDSRKNRREVRGVVTGLGTVRLVDAGL